MPLDITQYYQFTPLDGSGDLIVRRGEDPPTITAGGARWKSVSRPKRTSIILFEGVDAYEMDVHVLFDGWIAELSVEDLVARLNQMRFPQKELQAPTKIRITGGVPVKGATWVIKDVTWGSNVIWSTKGNNAFRYRQDAVLHMLQYLPEESLQNIKPMNIADKVVVVKKGQTIHHLARGNPKAKKDIQKANGIRDPKSVKNKAGQPIKTLTPVEVMRIQRGFAGHAIGRVMGKIG